MTSNHKPDHYVVMHETVGPDGYSPSVYGRFSSLRAAQNAFRMLRGPREIILVSATGTRAIDRAMA